MCCENNGCTDYARLVPDSSNYQNNPATSRSKNWISDNHWWTWRPQLTDRPDARYSWLRSPKNFQLRLAWPSIRSYAWFLFYAERSNVTSAYWRCLSVYSSWRDFLNVLLAHLVSPLSLKGESIPAIDRRPSNVLQKHRTTWCLRYESGFDLCDWSTQSIDRAIGFRWC